MKERPILFSGPMVRSLLAGTKTQTRRAVANVDADGTVWKSKHRLSGARPMTDAPPDILEWCPYGQPGDRLWVREATHRRPMLSLLTGEPLDEKYDGGAYTADNEDMLNADGFDFAWWYSRRACPSIHMPRWASRILLDITSVRVERLQHISEADCCTEGAHGGHGSIPGYAYSATPQEHFQHLWTSTGGDWGANPWVWVIEFQRLNNPEAAL